MKFVRQEIQTHFIGVAVPEELAQKVAEYRAWMQEQYGCRSGYGTPAHITLIPPFCLPDSYADCDVSVVVGEIKERAADLLPFTARVCGFGAFGDRTLFAHVEQNSAWNELHLSAYESAAEHIPGAVRPDNRPFTPHLTIANRDIPRGSVPEALRFFSGIQLDCAFPVDTIVIFKRSERGGWIVAEKFSCGGTR